MELTDKGKKTLDRMFPGKPAGKPSRVNYGYFRHVLELLNHKERNDGLAKIRNQVKKDFPEYLRALTEMGETAPADVLQGLQKELYEAQEHVELMELLIEDFVLRFVRATHKGNFGYPRLDYDTRNACAKSPFGICVYDDKDGPSHSPCIYCGVSKYQDEPSIVGIQSDRWHLERACRYCGTLMNKGGLDVEKGPYRWNYVNGYLICPVCWSFAFGRYPEEKCFGKHLKLMHYAEHRKITEQFTLMLEEGELYRDGMYVVGSSFEENLRASPPGGPDPIPGTRDAREIGCFCPGKLAGGWWTHKYCPYHGIHKTTKDIWINRDKRREKPDG
jgi:hypothetical protein